VRRNGLRLREVAGVFAPLDLSQCGAGRRGWRSAGRLGPSGVIDKSTGLIKSVSDSDNDGCPLWDLNPRIAPELDALIASRAGRAEVDEHHAVVLPIEDVPEDFLEGLSLRRRPGVSPVERRFMWDHGFTVSQRVQKLAYLGISPSRVRASSRAWTSSTRR